jgi:hypothetical protein
MTGWRGDLQKTRQKNIPSLRISKILFEISVFTSEDSKCDKTARLYTYD